MQRKSNTLNISILLFFSICTFVLSFATCIYHILESGGIGFADHQWLWAECACTLHGIDSAEAIQQGIVVPGVTLPESTSTFPWTKILGIVVHGSFLPYRMSCVYYVILNLIVLIAMLVLVYRYMLSYSNSHSVAISSVLLMLSSWYLTDLVISNNNATMLCALIIIAILWEDNHEVMAGVLVAFAMIKAQIVLPFCLLWLLRKRWKLLSAAAVIDILCWMTSVIITGVSPVRQLSNILNMRVEMTGNYLVYGIFDGLREFGVSSTAVLLLSMLLGCTAVVIGHFLNERYLPQNFVWIRWSLPAIVSVFWCYKSQCDYNILMIVALALVELWLVHSGIDAFSTIVVTMIALLMKPVAFVSAIMGRLGLLDRTAAYYMVNRMDLYLKCIVYFLFCVVVIKSVKECGLK